MSHPHFQAAHTPASSPNTSCSPAAPCIPKAKIKEELQADTVVVSDVYGDGRHVSINVVSNAFEGEHAGHRGSLTVQLPVGRSSLLVLPAVDVFADCRQQQQVAKQHAVCPLLVMSCTFCMQQIRNVERL